MTFYRTRRFILSVLITVACIVSVVGYAAYNNTQYETTSQQIANANAIITKALAVSDEARSLISQQRAYLITGDDQYLSNYNDSKITIAQTIAELFDMLEGSTGQAARLETFHSNYLNLTTKLEQRLSSRSSELDDVPMIDSVEKELMALVNGILNAEYDRLNVRIGQLSNIQERLLFTVILGIMAIGLLIGFLNYYLYQLKNENLLIGDTLSQTEERLKYAFEASQEGLYDWNLKKNHVFYSRLFCRMLGIEQPDMAPTVEAFMDMLHPDDKERVSDSVDRFVRDELSEYSIQFRLKHKDDRYIWVHSRALALRDKTGMATRIIGTHRDITNYKQTEHHLSMTVEDAQKSAKVKSEFLAHMSHEIRTPLTAISGIAEIMVKNIDRLDTRMQNLVRTLATSTMSLKELVNDILDFSKIEKGEIDLYDDYFSINDLAEEIISIMAVPASEKNLSFTVDYQDVRDTEFLGDKGRIRQVLLNLVGNAIKFTKNGHVNVLFGSHDTGHDLSALTVRIEDTGIGIDESMLDSIFDDFKQADSSVSREYGGTGLGLPISKRLAALMGGDITVESTLGKGSVFTLSLPMKSQSMEAAGADARFHHKINDRLRSAIRDEQRVLVVEDYEGNVVILSYLLEEIGLGFDLARNGAEAVDMWKDRHYDLILMDVQMPVMDGLTATGHIRKLEAENGFKTTPIIGMTAHALVEDKEKCIAAGMDDYMPKPLDNALFKEKLLKYLKRDAANDGGKRNAA